MTYDSPNKSRSGMNIRDKRRYITYNVSSTEVSCGAVVADDDTRTAAVVASGLATLARASVDVDALVTTAQQHSDGVAVVIGGERVVGGAGRGAADDLNVIIAGLLI